MNDYIDKITIDDPNVALTLDQLSFLRKHSILTAYAKWLGVPFEPNMPLTYTQKQFEADLAYLQSINDRITDRSGDTKNES